LLSSTTANALAEFANLGGGERKQGNGTEQSHRYAAGAGQLHHGFQNAAHNAVADEDDLGVVGPPAFGADGFALGPLVLGFQLQKVPFHEIRLQEERSQQVVAGLGGAPDCPIGRRGQKCARGEFHRLHHLPDVAVGQHRHGVAVLVGQIERQGGQVGHFLHGGGRQHQHAVIAVAAAFDHLVVVALLGRDVAQPGAAARDVGHHAGQFRPGQVAEAFLHEADARSAGGGHGAHAHRRGAVDHVHGRHFTLGL
jgi:hypothetical protein